MNTHLTPPLVAGLSSRARLSPKTVFRFGMAGVAVCGGFLVGVLPTHQATNGSDNSTIGAADSTWLLAKPPSGSVASLPNDREKAGGYLIQMWENASKVAEPREDPLTPPNWRIAGSSITHEGTSLIVVFEGSNAPTFVKVGEQIPGGGELIAVDDKFATILMNKKTVYLPLHKP